MFIFHNDFFVLSVVDEALYYFTVHSNLRVIVLNGLTANSIENLKALRPLADSYTIISDTQNMDKLFKKVIFLAVNISHNNLNIGRHL